MCSHLLSTSLVAVYVALFHTSANSTKMSNKLECDKSSSDEPRRSNGSGDSRASTHKPAHKWKWVCLSYESF